MTPEIRDYFQKVNELATNPGGPVILATASRFDTTGIYDLGQVVPGLTVVAQPFHEAIAELWGDAQPAGGSNFTLREFLNLFNPNDNRALTTRTGWVRDDASTDNPVDDIACYVKDVAVRNLVVIDRFAHWVVLSRRKGLHG